MSGRGADAELERVFQRAERAMPTLDPAVAERIMSRLSGSLAPVKRLTRPSRQLAALLLGYAALALAEAAAAGFEGLAALGLRRGLVILMALMLLSAGMAREVLARSMPGSRVRVSPATALIGVCASVALLFGCLLHEAPGRDFVAAGLACLRQGILHAIPAALLGAWILRRGFSTRPVASALMSGSLAALTGVAFLEMHCQNLDAVHQIVWHTAVIPAGALLAALAIGLTRRVAAGASAQ